MKRLKLIGCIVLYLCIIPVSLYSWDGAWNSLQTLFGKPHTWTGAQTFNTVDINSGTIDGTDIGAAVQGTGEFSSVAATSLNTTTLTSDASGVTCPSGVSITGGQFYNANYAGFGTKTPQAKVHAVEGEGAVPALNTNTLIIQNNANAGDYARFSLLGGNTGGSLIELGDTDDIDAGFIGMYHQYSIVRMATGAAHIEVNGVGNVGIGTNLVFSNGYATLEFKAGVTPTTFPHPGFVALVVSGVSEMFAFDRGGSFTQLSSHDPVTGEFYRNEFNVYTGIGSRTYESGAVINYTVDKVNPAEAYKEQWFKDLPATVEVADDFFTEVDNEIDGHIVDPVTKYEAIDGKIIAKQDRKVTKIKTKLGTKKVLKPDYVLNADTGKVYRKPTREEAEKGQLVFDWTTMPKFVRDAWGK